MRKLFVSIAMTTFMFVALALASYAQGTWPPPEFTAADMKGAWATQMVGEAFLPPPFDTYNGPFVRTGRLLITPDGKVKAVVVVNYNGTVEWESIEGNYTISTAGYVIIHLLNVPLPSLPPGTPNEFTFEGVICEGGKKVKLMMSGVKIGDTQLPKIGSVIYGELVRQ